MQNHKCDGRSVKIVKESCQVGWRMMLYPQNISRLLKIVCQMLWGEDQLSFDCRLLLVWPPRTQTVFSIIVSWLLAGAVMQARLIYDSWNCLGRANADWHDGIACRRSHMPSYAQNALESNMDHEDWDQSSRWSLSASTWQYLVETCFKVVWLGGLAPNCAGGPSGFHEDRKEGWLTRHASDSEIKLKKQSRSHIEPQGPKL